MKKVNQKIWCCALGLALPMSIMAQANQQPGVQAMPPQQSALQQPAPSQPTLGQNAPTSAAPNPATPALPAPGQYTMPSIAPPPVAQAPIGPATPPSSLPRGLPPLPGVDLEMAMVKQEYLGITPQEIVELRRMLDERQRAAAQWPNPPKSVTGSVSASLQPGSTPPVIRPFVGLSTSFVVVDSTGAPWPVENFRVGNQAVFPVTRLDGPQGSSFAIESMLPYARSNITLQLAGMPTPVVIELLAGQDEHDARVDLRVEGRGPNAKVTGRQLIPGTDARLLSVLDGVPPDGKPVMISGVQGARGWILPNGILLVRSPVKIVSPASRNFLASADGTHVYEFTKTTQLLGLVNHQFVTMTVSGW